MEWKEWQCIPFKERHNLPSTSGIYLIADANANVWYVGQAINLNNRWLGKGHHRYAQLSRSNGKRQYYIYWNACPAAELSQMERHYINLFHPPMNGTRVKQYSPGKPQLKIEISHAGTTTHIFCRGNPDSYEGISEYVGVFPCLPEDQQNVPMQQRQVLRRYALVLAVKYLINGKHKTVKVLCSVSKFGHAYNFLRGLPYKGGIILEVWQPRRTGYR